MMKFKTKFDTIGKFVFQPRSDKPSLTDESFKQECDIEFIISNFVQRGIEPPQHQVDYGKQITGADFMSAMETVAECKSVFESLSATEKERFDNSVTKFLDFVSDSSNLRESYEKGYINPDTVDISDIYPERFIRDNAGPNISSSFDSHELPVHGPALPTVNEGQNGPAVGSSNPT